MLKNKISILALFFIVAIASCKKTEYNLGEIKTPTNLTANATVVDTLGGNPNGDGSGKVKIIANAANAISYTINYGDDTKETVQGSSINTVHKYGTPGTNDYTITVTAYGTAGSASVVVLPVKVFVEFQIPALILNSLTGGSSKIWVTDKTEDGHVGVGPNSGFSPDWYAATANSRQPCLYDDEITFTKVSDNVISMSVDNKGQTFIIGAAAAYYGLGSAEDCITITTAPHQLIFSDASSASTSSNSTRVQFKVTGNGIVNFATGADTYEILSISATQIHLRNIGADGNAWYQKLKVK